MLDLGCGVGGDTLALAQYRPVIAYERNLVRLRFAAANARAPGLAGRAEFRGGDWTEDLANGRLPQAAAAFVDPSLADGRRASLQRMQPPLATLLRLNAQFPALGVKVMPGVNERERCPPAAASSSSATRDVRAVLWFGALAQHLRWASVHDGARWHALVASGAAPLRVLWPPA